MSLKSATLSWWATQSKIKKIAWITLGAAMVPGVIVGIITKATPVFIGVVAVAAASVITLAVASIKNL